MKKGLIKKLKCLFALSFMIPLSGCGDPFSFKLASVGVIATIEGVFKNPEINLKEKNYAAADYLTSQLQRNKVRYGSSIHAMPFEESDNPGISSAFGLKVPEGIGLRFIELGYNTWLYDVAHGANSGLYLPPKSGDNPDYKMTGRYTVRDKHIDVFIRILDTKTSHVVAQFDYAMPLNKELRDLSKTPTQIYRVK